MARVEISFGMVRQAMQSQPVRAALRKRADRIHSRAQSIASSESVELESEVTEGTRPRGRPYARVQSRNVGQEWGDSKTARRRVLGRAAESA
jgi:hypothetical protein